MAQAARLNLRMQKEISLLLSDPPHGASFPNLSSSLSSIDAQIEGPEGTVYARGIFRISIQIPDRYPFQPPIVTFATPIYHPNIDNGGRICLDILNLPPKGAWQPSLNISTVLISIGLLLSEPNPDDGLMCEASREYKYNRQAFDQKARVMTEKYAKSGCTGSGGSILGIQNTSDNFVQSQDEETEGKPHCDDFKSFASSSKPRGIRRRLSLAPSESTSKIDDDNPAKDMTVSVMRNNMSTGGTEHQLKFSQDDFHLSHSKLSMSRRKLSLDSSGQFKKGNCEFNEQEVSGFGKQTHMSHDGKLAKRNAEAASCSSDQVDDAMREHPPVSLSCSEHDFADKIRSILIDTKLKRFPVNRKVLEPSSGSNETLEKDTNVNIRPSCKSTILQSQNSTKSCSLSSTTPRAGDHASDFSQGNCDLSPNHKKCKFDAVATLEPAKKSDKHESIALETVIVLDSDNSDDERKQKKPKLKLSLSTRRLVSKGKAKA